MDTTIVIVAILIILAVIIPMVVYNQMQKSKKQKKEKHFLSLGEKNNMHIEEYDFSLYAAIGIDKKSGKLIYIHGKKTEEPEIVVDLKKYKSCEAANISRSVGSGANLTTIIDRVELLLRPKESTEKELRLEFFNSEHDSHITDENDLVTKWAGNINQWIRSR